ncbi:MAG: LacI family DNA-binding transcriptional regulator [Armatimonadota bacterium]
MRTRGSDTPQDVSVLTHSTDFHAVVTQRDIAQRCGMHQTTVSLALRSDPRIAPATIEQVRAIAAEMGYDPTLQTSARRLASRRFGRHVVNHVVAVSLFPSFMHVNYYTQLFSGIVDVLLPAGYSPVLIDLRTPHSAAGLPDVPMIMKRGDVDGIIIDAGDNFSLLTEHLRNTDGFGDRPIISLIRSTDRYSSIIPDDGQGAYLAARHLLELGHRHILQLCSTTDPQMSPLSANRWEGVRQALREAGLRPESHLHFFVTAHAWSNPLNLDDPTHAAWNVDRNQSADHPLVEYLRAHPEITAILGMNDANALQAWALLNHAGLQVPEDISIIGFDDVDPKLDEYGHNILTSVHLPLVEIGQEAARLMIEAIVDRGYNPRQLILPTELAVRKSTAPPRER